MIQAPEALVHLFAPWQEFYSNSKVAETGTIFVHLAAMLFGGGTAIVADRATLRVKKVDGPDREVLDDLCHSHRMVVTALTFSAISGVAMATADLNTFFGSVYFWIKLSLVFLLLLNGAFLYKTEHDFRNGRGCEGPAVEGTSVGTQTGARLWGRLRIFARCSLVLWTATLLAGTILVNMV